MLPFCRSADLSRFWTVLGVVLCAAGTGEAQEIPSRVRQISVDRGLPSPVVTAITQDQHGFLWVGTGSGLARFDGSGVTAFRPDPTNPFAFPSGQVRDLIVTRDDAVWAAVEGAGVVVLNPDRNDFHIFRHLPGDATSLPSVNVKQLMEDRRGRVWVGLQNATVAVLDRNSGVFAEIRLRPGRAPTGVDDRIGAFAEASDGRIWVATYGGRLYSVDPETLEPTKVPLDYGPDVPFPSLRALQFQSDTDLWIGTFGMGIARLDTSSLQTTWIRASGADGHALSSDDVTALVPGRDSVAWAATYGGGINRIDPRTGNVEWLREPLTDPRVVDLFVSRDGGFWIGTWGGGLNSFNPPMDAFRTYSVPGGEASEEIDVTFVAPSAQPNRVWIATYGQGIYTLNLATNELRLASVQPSESERSMIQLLTVLEARDGSVFVGSGGRGLMVLRPGSDSFDVVPGRWASGATISYLHEDAAGRVWVGTRVGLGVIAHPGDEPQPVPLEFLDDDLAEPAIHKLLSGPDGLLLLGTEIGLAVLDPATHLGRWVFGGRPQEGSRGGSSHHDHVKDLAAGPDGTLWAGLEAGGLVKISPMADLIDGPGPQIERGIAAQGLPHMEVESLEFDSSGRLWVFTGGGLAEFNPQTGSIRSFFEVDGLASDAGSSAAMLRVGETLISGSRAGLTTFDPGRIPPGSAPPSVAVTGVQRVVDNDISFDPLPGDYLEIPWRRGHLLFEFSVVDLRSTVPPTYEYRLSDTAPWIPLGHTRTVAFSNDAPGSYSLAVRAETARGQRTKESKAIQIVVLGPWWMTRWAKALGLTGFAALLYGLRSARTHRVRVHNIALRKEIRDRQRAESDRDSFEEQFRQAQKLEAVGKLTGGIAHDFNNFLSVIHGSLELLALDRPDDPEVQDRTKDALHATHQAAVLTKRLLSFSQKQVLTPLNVDLPEMMEQLARLLRPSLGELYELRIVAPSEVWTFSADRAHLESALLNLVINARDAQESGGVIRLEVENRTLTRNKAREIDMEGAEGLYHAVETREFVALSVADEGIGMPADVLTRAVDPFFTTKGVGRGSGLGLSMVYGFVHQSAGLLSIASTPTKGTTVSMFFPRA